MEGYHLKIHAVFLGFAFSWVALCITMYILSMGVRPFVWNHKKEKGKPLSLFNHVLILACLQLMI